MKTVINKYWPVLAGAGLLLLSFRNNPAPRFDTIDVHRLNIVDSNGHLVLVIGAKGTLPGSTLNGKEFSHQQRGAGMIFYNDDGDECGGYQWGGDATGSGAIMAFDQYKQDQIISLNYQETRGAFGDPNKKRFAGLTISPQPTALPLDELVARYQAARKTRDTAALHRLNDFYTSTSLFVGKQQNDDMGLFIKDANEKPRLKLYTDKKGNPRLEFMDSLGRVILRFPQP